jgi:glutamyl-tRNA synthetase
MDWGNAFVRSKTTGTNGEITSIEMELHLEGDFRKTKKKITWLPQLPDETVLVDVTLLDHDYLITKKKLEENDELKDFVPPVTEFRTEAYADANVNDLIKGDIIQFERKGYYIFDGIAGEGVAKRLEFIHIPDGKQASLASKAGGTEVFSGQPKESSNKHQANKSRNAGVETPSPVETQMYKVNKIYGDDVELPAESSKMYPVKNPYH